jgi:hypothetical protein
MQSASPVQARLPDCGFAGNVAHMLCDKGRLTIVIPVLDEAAIIAAAPK